MTLSLAAARPVALLGAAALTATLVTATPNEADAAPLPCRIDVTTRLDKSATFEGGGTAKYYWATAAGSQVGQYDHKGNVIMTTFPAGAYPELINKKIGERQAIGDMTKTQSAQALGSINGDFFITPDIRYESSIEMVRGPMVKDGKPIRGIYKRMRIVGIDKNLQPYGEFMGVRGSVQAQLTDAPEVKLRALNWQKVLGGGVSVFTTDWSALTRNDGKATYPRPAGEVEWVVNGRNELVEVRNATKNAGKRGDPVARGTRVIAFAPNVADLAKGVPLSTKITVKIRQSTTTGVNLLTGVGRGLPMIEAGKPAPLGCRTYAQSQSARPRTFVGWDDLGRWRAFTVPGSKLENVNGSLLRNGGFGLASAANIARKLGMTYAYELDGGGSTTLWTRKAETWTRRDMYQVRNPSGCDCERWMGNGLAFVQPG